LFGFSLSTTDSQGRQINYTPNNPDSDSMSITATGPNTASSGSSASIVVNPGVLATNAVY